MSRCHPSVSARTATFAPCELALLTEGNLSSAPPRPILAKVVDPAKPQGRSLREAVRCWLEEKL